MAEFVYVNPATEQVLKKYNGEYDRILEFGGKYGLLQEAAKARAAFKKAHAAEPFKCDVYYANLPETTPNMAIDAKSVESLLEILRCYVEISYDHGTTKDPIEIAARRERAGEFIAEIQLANTVFEEVKDLDYNVFLTGGEGWGNAA